MTRPNVNLDAGMTRAMDVLKMAGGRSRHYAQYMGEYVQWLYAPASELLDWDGRFVYVMDLGSDVQAFYRKGVEESLNAWDWAIRAGFICC